MANQWLRLWHDMPTDPKWRTIARASGQPIALVQAVYLHLLVDASRNVTRGHATVTQEDLASSLDVTEEAVGSVLAAMQGRVLEEMRLMGWEARQPKREDAGDDSTGAKSAAQRKAEQRERDRLAALEAAEQDCHDASRNVTLDKDKDKIKKEAKASYSEDFEAAYGLYPSRPGKSKADAYKAWLARLKDGATPMAMTLGVTRYAEYCKACGTEPRFIKQPATFFGPGEFYLADWTASAPVVRHVANGNRYAAAAAGIFGAPQQQRGEVIDV